LAGPPGGWGHSPEADRGGAAGGFGHGLQHHSEKVGPPPGHGGLSCGHHHRRGAREKFCAFPFLQRQEHRSSKCKTWASRAFPVPCAVPEGFLQWGQCTAEVWDGKRPPVAEGRWDPASYPERWELT